MLRFIFVSVLSFVITFSFAQITTIELNENRMGDGGEIILREETGPSYFQVQGDIDGTGGFFTVKDGDGADFFFADGNFSNNNGRVVIGFNSGNSSTTFNTDETGNDAVILPTDAVNSSEIENEVGLSHETTGFITIGTSLTVLNSTTITVPTDGQVLVLANGQLQMDHTNGDNSFVDFGVSDDSTSLPSRQDVAIGVDDNAPNALYLYSANAFGVFDVTAGSHTFYALGRQLNAGSTPGDIDIIDQKMTAIFIPTAYGTVEAEFNGSSSGTSAKTINDVRQPDSDSSLPEYEQQATASSGESAEETAQKRLASIAANQARIEKELAEVKAFLAKQKKNPNGLDNAEKNR